MNFTFRHLGSVLALSASLLSACGGGGDGGTAAPASASAQVTGKFVDATVVGLGYKCGSSTTMNTTNAQGEFTCPADQSVNYYVGGILLGSVSKPQAVVTPLDLAGNGSTPATLRVTNMVRFLMSLSTTNPSSGVITLDSAAVTAAAGQSIDFSTVSDASLTAKITQLRPTATVYSASAAQTHMGSSLNGLFAGAYSGTFSGGDSGTWNVTISSGGVISSGTVLFVGGSGPITGSMSTTMSTGSTYGFTGFGNGIPWTGTLNINTKAFSGTWNNGAGFSGTFTGKAN